MITYAIQVVGSEFLFSHVFIWALCLSQLSSTPYVSYTLPLFYSVCRPVSLSVSLFHSLLVEIDGLWIGSRACALRRLSLKMSGRSLGSRLGLSTPVGSNFGQTTVALIWVWVYRVAQKCRPILCNMK